MKVIGITGGIGSGKSTVSQFLAELGAVIIDADKVGHEAFKPHTETWREVVAAFGRQILTSKGDIDRGKLGKIVFGSPESLEQLNRIMHPRMYDMVKARLEEYRRRGVEVVVLEATLLLEAGWTSLVDEVWVTMAGEATVLKRLQGRGGLSEPEALARIRSQMSNEERVKHSDVIVNNDCDLTELKVRVGELWQSLHTGGTGRPGKTA
jgi:dephospho-CoA kinase